MGGDIFQITVELPDNDMKVYELRIIDVGGGYDVSRVVDGAVDSKGLDYLGFKINIGREATL